MACRCCGSPPQIYLHGSDPSGQCQWVARAHLVRLALRRGPRWHLVGTHQCLSTTPALRLFPGTTRSWHRATGLSGSYEAARPLRWGPEGSARETLGDLSSPGSEPRGARPSLGDPLPTPVYTWRRLFWNFLFYPKGFCFPSRSLLANKGTSWEGGCSVPGRLLQHCPFFGRGAFPHPTIPWLSTSVYCVTVETVCSGQIPWDSPHRPHFGHP